MNPGISFRGGLITISDSVTYIDYGAFDSCDNLTDVYYIGTEEQWNRISIIGRDSSRNYLKRATIHYNSTGNAPAPSPAPPDMKLNAVSVAEQSVKTETFADLKPNTLYNFYAFTDKETDDILSAENLLYIAQFTTDENGNADIPYTPTDDQILIVGAMYSIAVADINANDVFYTGSEVVPNLIVAWNGIELAEGVDYEIYGDLSATEIGTYKIVIRGMGEFLGSTTVRYNIICGHDFSGGICTICGETEPIMTTTITTTTTSTTSTTTTTAKPTTTSTTSTTTTTIKSTTTSTTSTITTTAEPTTTSTTSTTTTTAKPTTTTSTTMPTTTTSTTIITETPVSDLLYKKYNDHVEITGCNKDITDVRIPAEIEGLPVTEIGYGAFYECSNLESVVIPSGVTSIDDKTFWGCISLENINIPDSVTSIGKSAFECCYSLKNIIIPDSVVSIGSSAFWLCSSLESITIGNSVANIGGFAFANCSKLKDVYISDLSSWLKIDFTSFASTPMSEAYNIYLNNTLIKNIMIPKDMEKINNYTFYGFSSLENVVISDSVTSIGNDAFALCSKLTSITIPDSVTNIGNGAFEGCSRLTSVIVPNSVTNIGDYAFGHCSNLESITILNPECEIYDDIDTISNGQDYNDYTNFYFDGIIYGYENSTAQKYAEKYNRTFVKLDESEIVLGDVNGDGMIDAVDATAVLVEYANLSTGGSGIFSDNQKSAGDVNSDNMIDAVDASMILTFYAYLSTGGTENDMRVWLNI